MKHWLWFVGGFFLGLTALSISKASTRKNRVTDDTALYQQLSEIQVPKEPRLSFEADIQRLSHLEKKFQEKLPLRRSLKHSRE